MEKSNIDNLYYLSIESSMLGKDKYKNSSTEEIISIQYQKLDGDGYPTSDIVTLKEWESNEETILKEFLNVYNIHNSFAFTPVDNMINYSLLTIGSRLLHYNLISRDGICKLLFNRPSINLMPILRILNNMDIRSGLVINKVARDNIPILYKNKQYNEIEKILEKKSNGMIKSFQLFVSRIPIIFSNEFNEYINNTENEED